MTKIKTMWFLKEPDPSDRMLGLRTRTPSVSEFVGAHLQMGRKARGSGEAIAVFEVWEEGMQHSSYRDAKAARDAGALRLAAAKRRITQCEIPRR
jgi:hypothetical protein